MTLTYTRQHTMCQHQLAACTTPYGWFGACYRTQRNAICSVSLKVMLATLDRPYEQKLSGM